MSPDPSLYDTDFFVWTQQQAALLRDGKAVELDWENLAVEIESLGKRDRKEVRSRLKVLVMHLLKWCYQPDQRRGSWASTIETQRDEIATELRDSPSLRGHVPTLMAEGYKTSRRNAQADTGLPLETFPETCPWMAEQVLDEDFCPECIPEVEDVTEAPDY